MTSPKFHAAAVAALQQTGPLSSQSLAKLLGWTVVRSGQVIGSGRKRKPGQMFCVVGFESRPNENRSVAIYSAAGGVDAQRPPAAPKIRKSISSAAQGWPALKESERLVIPLELRPHCAATTPIGYRASELTYRGMK